MKRFLFPCALLACALPAWSSPNPPRSVAAPKAASGATISISDARLVEPPFGQKSMYFAVTLSQPWPQDVRFSYATSAGLAGVAASTLAQPGLDFAASQGQLTIPAGDLRAQIAVPILSDPQALNNETFTVGISDVSGTDTLGNTVGLGRSLATGTIVKAIKAVVLSGQVTSNIVTPSGFNAPARIVPLRGVMVFIDSPALSRIVTTDSRGNYSATVRPGTYTVRLADFTLTDGSGTPQTYSIPARTVTITGDSTANSFTFYGVAGSVSIPESSDPSLQGAATIQIEVRPVGAAPDSPPVGSTRATFPARVRTKPVKTTTKAATTFRGVRFFLPALPPGQYTLTATDGGSGDAVTSFLGTYAFPASTISVPDINGVNRPDAHVTIVGRPMNNTSPSAPSS